jgi:hypothetical protein
MAANVNARSAGGVCPSTMFARVSRAMSPARAKYQTATTRTGGSSSSGRSAQKPCRKSAGGATIAVQAND